MLALTFTKADAQLLVTFLASVAVPFVVSWLKQPSWSKPARFALAVVLSAAGGLLAEYVAGTLDSGSAIAAAIAVFMAAQVHYRSWFAGLGLEDWLNPTG